MQFKVRGFAMQGLFRHAPTNESNIDASRVDKCVRPAIACSSAHIRSGDFSPKKFTCSSNARVRVLSACEELARRRLSGSFGRERGSLAELVTEDRHALREVHRLVVGSGRNRRGALAHRDLGAAEAELLAPEDERERVLLAELLLREPRHLGRRELFVNLPPANRGRCNGKMHVRERLGERVDAADRLQDVERLPSPTTRKRCRAAAAAFPRSRGRGSRSSSSRAPPRRRSRPRAARRG